MRASVYLHIYVRRECSAEPSIRKTPCDYGFFHLPGSRQRFLILMQIQCSYEHTFVIKSTVKYIRGGVSNCIFDYLPAVVYKLYNRTIHRRWTVYSVLVELGVLLSTVYNRRYRRVDSIHCICLTTINSIQQSTTACTLLTTEYFLTRELASPPRPSSHLCGLLCSSVGGYESEAESHRCVE